MSNEEQMKQLRETLKDLENKMGVSIQVKEKKTAGEFMTDMWERTKNDTVVATKATSRFFQASWRLTKAGCSALGKEMEAIKKEQSK